MQLRQRTVLIIGTAILVLIALVYTGQQWATRSRVTAMEKGQVSNALERARFSIEGEIARLETLATDWAAWDETYAYVRGNNPGFIESNLGDGALLGDEINLAMFFDARGMLIDTRAVDLQTGKLASLPDGLVSLVTPDSSLLQFQTIHTSHSGYLLIPGEILIVSTHPVITSDFQGNQAGTLLFGKIIDDGVIGKISQYSQGKLTLVSLGPSYLPLGEHQFGEAYLEWNGENQMIGFMAVPDLLGRPLWLRIELPRDVYQQARVDGIITLIMLTFVGIVVCALCLVTIERYILSRMRKIGQEISQIGSSKDSNARLVVSGVDELFELGQTINQMLARLQSAEIRHRESDAHYRSLVEVSPDAIFIQRDGKILFANPAAASLIGVADPRGLIGRILEDFIHPNQRDQITRRFEEMPLAGNPVNLSENWITLADNRTVYLNISVGLIDFDGQPATEVIIHDLTEQVKQAESRRLEEQYLAALNQMSQMATSALDYQATVQMLADQLTGIIQADSAFITHWDGEQGLTIPVAAKDIPSELYQQYQSGSNDHTMTRSVLEAGVPLVAEDVFNTPYINPEIAALFPTRSLLGVPLIADGKKLGAVLIGFNTPHSFSPEEIARVDQAAGPISLALAKARLFENLARAYDETIEGWSRALELRDRETQGHSDRVTKCTLLLAREMGILDEEELRQIRRGALLHDIGKMGVPDEILLKPGKLTPEEWEIMKRHTEHAYQLLLPISFLRQAIDIPYCHHEKWDGSGYPRGLKGEEIPLAARIFAIVDVWDALSSDRPYKNAWPLEQILDHLNSQSGKHFDPRVVEAFMRFFTRKDIQAFSQQGFPLLGKQIQSIDRP